MKVYNSYDVVGDIAILRLSEASEKYCEVIAKTVMDVHRNVRTVLVQAGPVHGSFRTREFHHVTGESNVVTTHVEAGCTFSVDVSKCYFSPRLSYERMRVARLVRDEEVVVNMFAGLGCFSLLISKHSNAAMVYSIDANPSAFYYMRENVRMNGAYGKVIPMLGDAKEIIEAKLRHLADRVLMPLPEKALEYLPYSLLTLKKTGGWVHYYCFEHGRKRVDAIEKAELKVAQKLADLRAAFDVPLGRVVRSTGPNWYQVVLDITING